MTTIYDTDDEGNIIVVFDSRWRFPELLGYSPDDPEYAVLQRMWEKSTGRKIQTFGQKLEQRVLGTSVPREEDERNGEAGEQQRQDK